MYNLYMYMYPTCMGLHCLFNHHCKAVITGYGRHLPHTKDLQNGNDNFLLLILKIHDDNSANRNLKSSTLNTPLYTCDGRRHVDLLLDSNS